MFHLNSQQRPQEASQQWLILLSDNDQKIKEDSSLFGPCYSVIMNYKTPDATTLWKGFLYNYIDTFTEIQIVYVGGGCRWQPYISFSKAPSTF